MSNKLPADVAKEVKERVYKEAERVDYLALSRTDSGAFQGRLVHQDDVGGIIGKYVPKAEIKTYIKDAILNRYSKDKTEEARPSDLKSIIKSIYGISSEETHKETKIHLFRSISDQTQNEYVVVAEGTMLKWETALRKALLFTAGKPFSRNGANIHFLLLLFAQHKPVPPSDKTHLDQALKLSNAKAYVFGEK